MSRSIIGNNFGRSYKNQQSQGFTQYSSEEILTNPGSQRDNLLTIRSELHKITEKFIETSNNTTSSVINSFKAIEQQEFSRLSEDLKESKLKMQETLENVSNKLQVNSNKLKEMKTSLTDVSGLVDKNHHKLLSNISILLRRLQGSQPKPQKRKIELKKPLKKTLRITP